MDDVVPSFLQHLRAADILRVAGLPTASKGQEFCRVGAVQATMRRGSQLLGAVDTALLAQRQSASPLYHASTTEQAFPDQPCFEVSIEVARDATWTSYCSCSPGAAGPCAHAAAVLYQWLAHPTTFFTLDREQGRDEGKLNGQNGQNGQNGHSDIALSPMLPRPIDVNTMNKLPHVKADATAITTGQQKPLVVMRGPAAFDDLGGLLFQIGLSDLRVMAREFEIPTTGLNRQQLADALAEALNQPETVRKVTATLEKPERQLLATIILAGGSVTDDELHGLFERFSFGKSEKLQSILLSLQNKGLLFHTSMNASPQQRIGLSGALIDIGWHVPPSVRSALHVPVPTTPYNIQGDLDGQQDSVSLQQSEPDTLLADLLLLARVLDGYRLEQHVEKDARRLPRQTAPIPTRYSTVPTGGEISLIAPPDGYLPASFIEKLQAAVPRSTTYLRFAVRLLLLSGILSTDGAEESAMPILHLLPNVSQVLLGPNRYAAFRDLFELWLTQSSYDELFELQDEGLFLRCRTTPLNHPILRNGELEAENCEARQLLIALISQAPTQQWIQYPPFARFMYRLQPLFLQKRQRLFSSPHWWLEQEEGRSLQPMQMADWMLAEGQYLNRILRGPLHWWGCTDAAIAADGRLLAFRLTPIAEWLFNGADLNALPPTSSRKPSSLVEVGESGELLILPHIAAWPYIELIEDFAEAAGVRAGRLCYRFTPRLLSAAIGRGKNPAALIVLLGQILDREMQPQQRESLETCLEQIEQWSANYGRVRLYTGVSMLEVADTAVMRELKLTTTVERHIVRSLSPTLSILQKQGIDQLFDDLKRRGQVPLLHEEEDDGTERS
jgi:hypothetical protein